MNNWQITGAKRLSGITTTENLERVDEVKIKTTNCFITAKDLDLYSGKIKEELPYTPCEIAVGQVVETLKDSNYIKKGSKVFLSPKFVSESKCGYLKDFVVVPESDVFVLPDNVSNRDALFVNHVSLALKVIDELKIEKGNHVAIFGSSILANIIAQLVMYYQSVPIIIDNNEETLEIAHKTNVYYILKNDKTLESEINSITGGRKCSKVVFVTDCDVSFDLLSKVARQGASVAITGISNTKKKLSADIAFEKELEVKFIKDGCDNVNAGINLLAQKAINLKYFDLPSYKFEYAPKHFENALLRLNESIYDAEFIIDML